MNRAGPDHRGVLGERCGDVGDGRAGRVLLPVPRPLGRVAPQAATAGVTRVVVRRQRLRVRGVPVDPLAARPAVGERAARAKVPEAGRGARHREARKALLEARIRAPGSERTGRRLACAVVELDGHLGELLERRKRRRVARNALDGVGRERDRIAERDPHRLVVDQGRRRLSHERARVEHRRLVGDEQVQEVEPAVIRVGVE